MVNNKKSNRILRTLSIHKRRRKYSNFAGKAAYVCLETPKRGSACGCCSNPRRSEKGKYKLTLQERKASHSLKD